MNDQRQIKFYFHPLKHEQNMHAVEKADGDGNKRRYLKGVSSGIQVDGHGERMTEKAIGSFSSQANSGDVLLYSDVHGVKFTDDIGILAGHQIDEAGDWHTEFRLYDEVDGAEPYQLQKANALWKQVNGLPPYTKPRQKGFSVEGHIPEDGIKSMDGKGRRVIDEVLLDGVVVVPRPAYKSSIAQAVFKALGEMSPWAEDKIAKSVAANIQETIMYEKDRDSYYQRHWQIEQALQTEIDRIMEDITIDDQSKFRLLAIAFDESRNLFISCIIEHKKMFEPEPEPTRKSALFKNLESELNKILTTKKEQLNANT